MCGRSSVPTRWELTPEEDRLVAGHLDGCAKCAAAYAEVADGAALLALFDEEDLW